MRFERVRLSNFKPYGDADLRLDRGVTVIHGLNGSGKSSLLEACFFALYGATALSGTLEDVITNGEEEAEIELRFTHAGGSYHVERRIRSTDDRAQTATCTLETPDGSIDGARDVESHVADLLRMDATAFVNCAYVRQGEVNKLIHATPGERQDMIDDLLQLGTLEEYRERASEARLGVDDVRSDVRGSLREIESRIEAKEDKELPARLNDLETDLNEIEATIDRFEANRANAEETREEAREVLDSHAETREEIGELEAEIEELRGTIGETETDREGLADRLGTLRERAEKLRAKRDDLLGDIDLGADADAATVSDRLADLKSEDDELREAIRETSLAKQEATSDARAARERTEDFESRADEKRAEADDLEREIGEDERTLDERREDVDALETEIEELRARFDDAPIEVGEAEAHLADLETERAERNEEHAELRTRLESACERVTEAEALLDEGRCPECGQAVEGSPRVDTLDDDRERIDDLESDLDDLESDLDDLDARIETVGSLVDAETRIEQVREQHATLADLLDERAETIDEKRERVETLRAEAAELDAEADDARSEAIDAENRAEDRQERLTDLDAERGELADTIGTVETIASLFDDVDEHEDEIERVRERRESKAELNEERRERLAEKRDRKRELEAEYDPDRIDRAKTRKDEAEEYLERVDRKVDELATREDDLRDRIGGVRNELDELDALCDRRDRVREKLDALDALYEETERLQETYASLRGELRQRNVESLERMLNETFDLVYQNDSYAHIELTGEYELTVYQKDGQALDPEQLSGGERALFNLSLRCAIYRLLAEGIEGTAPMPPLVLDEPTVFLDAGHVSRLVDLVESMRDLGVEQIVVVSHDDELVGAADDLVTIRKDPTTNRSSIERGEKSSLTTG